MNGGWHQFDHLLGDVFSAALALLIAGTIVAVAQLFGIEWLVEPVHALGTLMRNAFGSMFRSSKVNVMYIDKEGRPIDLGKFLKAWLQNGRGRVIPLQHSVFAGCDPEMIGPGAYVNIFVQNRLLETLVVELDYERQMLFVRSNYHIEDIIALITGKSDTQIDLGAIPLGSRSTSAGPNSRAR